MNDFDPTMPNLELSEGEVKSLYDGLMAALIQHGMVSENPGVFGAEDGQAPYNFTYYLPQDVVGDIFYANDEQLIIAPGSYIQYAAPHRVEPDEGKPAIESILLVLQTKVVGSEDDCNQHIFFHQSNGHCEADFHTEYVRNGKRISPNNIPAGSDTSDPDVARALMEDVATFDRPLSLDDAEKLRKIEALIESS